MSDSNYRSGQTFLDTAPQQARTGKRIILSCGALAVLAVFVSIGLHLRENARRAEILNIIETHVQKAQAAFDVGALTEALQEAAAAKALIEPLPYPIDPVTKAEWQKPLDKIASFKAQIDALDVFLEEAKRDPTQAKEALQRKKALLDPAKPYIQPLWARINEVLDEATRLETEQRRQALYKDVEVAEALFTEKRFEDALEAATDIRDRLSIYTAIKDEELQNRLKFLREMGRYHQEAKAVYAGSRGKFKEARTRLAQLSDEINKNKGNVAPLISQLTAINAQLDEDEKHYRVFSNDELKQLTDTASTIAKFSNSVHVGKAIPEKGVALEIDDKPVFVAFAPKEEGSTVPAKPVFETDGHRFVLDQKRLRSKVNLDLRIMATLGPAMTRAGLMPGQEWLVEDEAPYPMAYREVNKRTEYFYVDTLYLEGDNAVDELAALRKEAAAAEEALKKAAAKLADAIEAEPSVRPQVAKVLTTLVRGAVKPLDVNDFLPMDWCRKVLAHGYIEQNIAPVPESIEDDLQVYRDAYAEYVKLRPRFAGVSAGGSEMAFTANADKHRVVRTYDAKHDLTFFGIKHPVHSVGERPHLHSVYEYKGKHLEMPTELEPRVVHMTHPALGNMASYTPADGKLHIDEDRWVLGATLTTRTDIPQHFGRPEWAFPPHVLLMDKLANPKGIVTETGVVDRPEFTQIENLEERRKKQNEYLDLMAKVLHSTGHLHLYFLYFHQYVLDSPIVTQTGLLGSRAHCGDIHQNVYESLDRSLAGRYLGDCDDLAELYQEVTERQGKLSYVMAVPGHATCGWLEQLEGNWVMQFLDTGPPRILFDEGQGIETLVEKASRTYDMEKTMRFDPKSVGFLFRFAGEPTRTPYYLSTRMFTDKQYADALIEVQSFWHFHYYALGIQVMEEMIANGDRVPENCVELAGLYGQVKMTEDSLKWTQEALNQLGKEDILSRHSETFRIGMMYANEQLYDKCYEAIRPAVAELAALNRTTNPQERLRHVSSRLSMASLLSTSGRPWEAWDLLKVDVFFFIQNNAIRLNHGAMLTSIYSKMKEMIDEEGHKPSKEEREAMTKLEEVLDWFYQNAIFREDDDFNDVLRNYAFIGNYYGARFGKEKLLQQLISDAPFPEKMVNHRNRFGKDKPTAEQAMQRDWPWVRLSILSYGMAIGDALDSTKPEEEQDRARAIALAEAMQRAAAHASKFGSLASSEFSLITTRVLHAFLTQNWAEFEKVLQHVERENFARLTSNVAETIGECARYVTPEVFAQQMVLFSKYIHTKAPYFTVVYEAYRNEAFEQARAAAQVCLKRWPGEQNMEREAVYLNELIDKRKKLLETYKTQRKERKAKAKPATTEQSQ